MNAVQRRDIQFNTEAEVTGYLKSALDLVDSLGPPDDLRVACFTQAAALLSGKQVMIEPVAMASGMDLAGLGARR